MTRFLILLAAWLSACSTALAAPTLTDPNLSVTEITSGLSAPTTMAFIGTDDILVLQKDNGQVRRVISGALQPSPVLDVAVGNASERGMLGIAVHPNFPSSPFIYLYYTESSTSSDTSGSAAGNRVYRYTWNGATLTSPLLIVDLPVTPGPNHDGGVIRFGPDGKLYVVIGDLNRDGQLQNFPGGPTPDDTSVILRLNDDGSIPSDNPFFSQGGNVAKYYAYGIRNSFGMAFDPVTNKLWMTENGPNLFDEINLVEPGFNSGWEKLMGPDARNANDATSLFSLSNSHYADPKFSWLDPVGPTGIVFLDSTSLGASYENDVFVGDINNGNLYHFKPNGSRNGFVFSGAGLADLVADNSAELNETIIGTGFAGITDLKIGPDGRLYVVSFGDGKIYAISNATSPPLSFGVATLPTAEMGVAYNVDLNIAGGNPPFSVSLVTGLLPPGLNLIGETIAGTLTAVKGSRFTLRVTDNLGASSTQRFNISAVGAVSIGNSSLPTGRVGRSYGARLAARSGKKPYTWSLVAGSLPSGLLLDATTGRITGTPVAVGDTNLTFQVTDALGGVVQKALTLSIK
ncbi:MAG TPA: PQQ-dependent sugar dehydrogenase [Candidatus Binatia bacterium]|nr:PQQ-dependent sugar dehydrogenase [Candidatus Binatia bacterium]